MITGWLSVMVAGVAGVFLAGLASFGVVNAAGNLQNNTPITNPLVVYGTR